MKNELSAEDALLSRAEFKRQVFLRSKGRCVFCAREAVDAHHVLERKLFGESGGYFLGNGAAVCAEHHWQCEATRLSPAQVRQAAGIKVPAIPPGFDPAAAYDKWGNRVCPSGLRTWGPLAKDTGARKALAVGGVLGLFMPVDDAAS